MYTIVTCVKEHVLQWVGLYDDPAVVPQIKRIHEKDGCAIHTIDTALNNYGRLDVEIGANKDMQKPTEFLRENQYHLITLLKMVRDHTGKNHVMQKADEMIKRIEDLGLFDEDADDDAVNWWACRKKKGDNSL